MTDELAFSSISRLSQKLCSGEVSSTQLVELFAQRIERFKNESNAFISLDLEAARERARTIAYSPDLALCGIPYACKDLFDVRGQVTSGGSKVLENEVAEADAAVIERMNTAGGIYLATLARPGVSH